MSECNPSDFVNCDRCVVVCKEYHNSLEELMHRIDRYVKGHDDFWPVYEAFLKAFEHGETMEPDTTKAIDKEEAAPELNLSRMHDLMDEYYAFRAKIRAATQDERLRCRELSIALTEIETGGLWLGAAYSQCASRVVFDKEAN